MENKTAVITSSYTGTDWKCPACHRPLVLQAQTRVKSSGLRPGGSTVFSTEMIASVEAEILSYTINHYCEPVKEKH